jgi:hypothetical protein
VLKAVHKISSWLLVALGVVHTSLTPMFYGRLSVGAMWFGGSGLAMIFVGFLNIALSRGDGRDGLVRILCYTANLMTSVFGVMIVVVNYEPQVIFGLVLIFLMTITALLLKK